MKPSPVPEVKLKFYATLRVKAETDEANCRAKRVKDVLAFLKKNYSEEFNKVLGTCHIFVNQDNVAFLNGPNTILKDGDVLHILPPTGGG